MARRTPPPALTASVRRLLRGHARLTDRLRALASDPDASAALLRELAFSADEQVVGAVVCNPATPAALLLRLLQLHPGTGGTDEEFRVHLAWNPSLPAQRLRHLCRHDPAAAVQEVARCALARRVATDPDATPRRLWDAYVSLRGRSVSRGMRQRPVRAQLLAHPRFPRQRLRRTR